MYYDTVKITPNIDNEKWEISFESMPFDRKKMDVSAPFADLGFFHYPRKWNKGKAFNMLKEAMIKRHVAMIINLTKSLKALVDLKLSDEG